MLQIFKIVINYNKVKKNIKAYNVLNLIIKFRNKNLTVNVI